MKTVHRFTVTLSPLEDSDGWRVVVRTSDFTIGDTIVTSRWRARSLADDMIQSYLDCYHAEETNDKIREVDNSL